MKPDAGRPQFRRPEQRRCAVYTRKSSDEGLDQEFNSLDAQREACSAYVKSQSGEGWRLLPAPYDDGGCSGGTMDRPALRRLLADIEAGRIDIIVVYKIDRLTRSLTDFARMVEIFDRHGVSFVSVTQAFNTTTSMGRLTLNVLLPFARFEREVTGERIRDKIAASKAKGMWMGGVLPIGYDRPIHGSRTLVVNETEAALVRRIFASYLDLGSVHALEHQLQREGIVSKRHVSSTGRETGGQPFSRGALFHLLRNRLYLGEIRHGDTYHPGLHPAIVDATLFDAVQHRLDGNARKRKSARESVARSALTGRIFDADGHPMSPTFAYGKGGRLYRYYVSAPLQQGARRSAGDTGPRRASGPALEESLATALRRLMPEDMRMDVDPLARILRIEVLRDGVEVVLPITLLRRLEPRLATGEQAAVDPADPTHLRLELPLRLSTHRGRTEILAAAPRPRKADLHARRLVAQRCLYGVDKNPRAVDLAKLSLWLATLAKDHEFTFLDHALKCGDSLVGLTPEQIAAANWDSSKPGLPLLRPLVAERVAEADRARAEIRSAPDDTMRAIQEQRHKHVEARLSPVRLLGDAVIAAFFSADKAKAREKARADAESWFSGRPARWDLLEAFAKSIREGSYGVSPFHWALEFPEVFKRENGGFDAIVGNPPFLGGAKIWPSLGPSYPDWLRETHRDSGGKAVDLVAHFFRKSFDLLRDGGAFGLVGTKTVSEGDTREAGLMSLKKGGADIFRADQGIQWPGEADVFVSVVHVERGGKGRTAFLNGRSVPGINSFLLPTSTEFSAKKLQENKRKAFRGCDVYGLGFIFSDDEKNGQAGTLQEMRDIINRDPRNADVIMPFIGGKELATDPAQCATRFAINFAEMSLQQAREWPDLMRIVESKVKPHRARLGGYSVAIRRRDYWWQYGTYTPALYNAIRSQTRVLAISRITTYIAFVFLPAKTVFNEKVIVLAARGEERDFAVVNSRAHELWALMWGTTLGETPNYSPPDCFETFPFPPAHEASEKLLNVGVAYDKQRSQIMLARNEGLTKTYNRFHDRSENSADIARLRDLHAEMDDAVLRAYGWDDLAEQAKPEFIEQDADEGKQAKTRLDWPSEFKDEVLARLLALNAERAEAERAAGLTALDEDDEEEDQDDNGDDE